MRIGHIGTILYTWIWGRLVGSDESKNRYFYRPGRGTRREKRWVLYSGDVEASRIPPEWHGWLHHSVTDPPAQQSKTGYAWIKPHSPNLTGTSQALLPPGHPLKGGRRPPATGDYQAWRPR